MKEKRWQILEMMFELEFGNSKPWNNKTMSSLSTIFSTKNVIGNFHHLQIPTDHGELSWQVCGLAEEYRQIVAVLQSNPQLLGQLEDDVGWNAEKVLMG